VLASLNRIASPLLSTIPNRSYRFVLFVSEAREVNAFALPGGYLVFNRGLLERARTPEEIQGVLAHEVAHVLKRHSLAQLAQNIGLEVAVQTLWGNENPYLDYLVRNGSQLLSLALIPRHKNGSSASGRKRARLAAASSNLLWSSSRPSSPGKPSRDPIMVR